MQPEPSKKRLSQKNLKTAENCQRDVDFLFLGAIIYLVATNK